MGECLFTCARVNIFVMALLSLVTHNLRSYSLTINREQVEIIAACGSPSWSNADPTGLHKRQYLRRQCYRIVGKRSYRPVRDRAITKPRIGAIKNMELESANGCRHQNQQLTTFDPVHRQAMSMVHRASFSATCSSRRQNLSHRLL
jgi:hypothetical protein